MEPILSLIFSPHSKNCVICADQVPELSFRAVLEKYKNKNQQLLTFG